MSDFDDGAFKAVFGFIFIVAVVFFIIGSLCPGTI